MDFGVRFPIQTLPAKSKGKKWREGCVMWAANRTYFNFSPVRQTVVNMKRNYDLLNGKLDMQDVAAILNPGNISTAFLPEKIQHYPIINSKINTLRGEEAARVFDWRVIVTNPYAISQIEEEKKRQYFTSIQQLVETEGLDQQQSEQQLQDNQDYFDRSWQDIRELRGNEVLKQYNKEQDFKQTFNDGFVDAATVGTEAYQCGIRGGEPFLVRLNPLKLRVFRSGYSNHIEDADVIIYEDYWSPGKIVEIYYDELTPKQIKWLSNEVPEFGGQNEIGEMGNVNEAAPFIPASAFGPDGVIWNTADGQGYYMDGLPMMEGGLGSDLLPYDVGGNVRVIQVWWKSKRKILKVRSFDEETGEENFDFYPETYIPDESKGEEAEALWVNEMWQGTKIGEDIYVGIRPCIVQHNSMSNPSRCHAGIIGTIYNINESVPFSLVDMMKPYNYLYDAVHAKLIDLIATNWGKLLELDLALKPKNWEVDKWMYFARANKVLIKDSFNEGSKGAALGKTAGNLNNASKGVIDADWGQSIQNHIELLQWAKDSMSDLVGINRQREGNTYSRETVGGIERAVLQSSYITDWLFQQHDNTKRRVLEAFLEEAKGAMRGRSKKFQYTLSDDSRKLIDIPGDEFCECDYGLVVDSSNDTQKLASQLDNLAQSALQNQYKLSLIARLYSSASLGEKIKIIEKAEKMVQEQQMQAAQQEQMLAQQKIQADMQAKQMEMQQKDLLNQRDNQTKIDVAEINARAEYLRLGIYEDQNNEELRREEMQIDIDKIDEMRREFDAELRHKEKELNVKKEIELKKIAAQKASKAASSNKK